MEALPAVAPNWDCSIGTEFVLILVRINDGPAMTLARVLPLTKLSGGLFCPPGIDYRSYSYAICMRTRRNGAAMAFRNRTPLRSGSA